MENKIKTCIDCGKEIAYKVSNNSKRCEGCKRKKYVTKKRVDAAKNHAAGMKKKTGSWSLRERAVITYGFKCAYCGWSILEPKKDILKTLGILIERGLLDYIRSLKYETLTENGFDKNWIKIFFGQNGLHIHHINEVSNGGEHTQDNVIMLCPNCHNCVHLGVILSKHLNSVIKPMLTDLQIKELVDEWRFYDVEV
jgi:5-methylcytosine-specific restriction endonuclease McrA